MATKRKLSLDEARTSDPIQPVTEDEFEALVPMLDLPSEPTMEGFEMSDDPPDDEIFEKPSARPQDARPTLEAPVHHPMPENAPSARPAPFPGLISDYESRIRILEAFQYQGSLAEAPAWIDRNWTGWVEYDEARKLPAGPCLRVPLEGIQADKVCRKGDYIVRQEIKLAGNLSDTRMEVWEKADFEKFFLPKEYV